MKRRNFLGILSGAAVTLLRQREANAQAPTRLLRVGNVSLASPRTAPQFVAFDQRLRELGYID